MSLNQKKKHKKINRALENEHLVNRKNKINPFDTIYSLHKNTIFSRTFQTSINSNTIQKLMRYL